MDKYSLSLKKELVEQFKGKPNIEALMEVIGSELQEVFDFYEQLRNERDLYNAIGKQLDGVGDIAVLTRMEAGQLTGNPIPIEVIDDDTYRKFLIYKVLKNTCDCTYPDIIKAFRMFWDKPLYYTEDPEQPATMIFDTGDLPGGTDTSPLFETPLLRAAGVTLKIIARTVEEMPRVTLHLFSGLGYAVTVTELPMLERNIDFGTKMFAGSGIQRVTEDTLPVLERKIDYGAKLYTGAGVQRIVQDMIPTTERSYRFRGGPRSGSAVQSIMETPIGGATIQQ